MGTKKTTTKKSPTGAPLGNPLKFFREAGEKRKAMFKNGGLSKKEPGGEVDPYSAAGNYGPKEQKAQEAYDLDNQSKTKGYSNVAAAKQWSTGTVAPYAPIKKKGGSVKRKK